MARLLALGIVPVAAMAASAGAYGGSNTLSGATKAESIGSTRSLFPAWSKDEQKSDGQRRAGLTGWGRQLQASDGGCGGGIAGVRSNDGVGNICCVEECGVCGGTGCSTAGGDGYDHTHCCVTSIESSGLMCDETGAAPCILEDDAGCGNGIAGVRSQDGTGDVCCLEECGVCGGPGCSTVAGSGYDSSHCCVTSIVEAGLTCDQTGEAPCLITSDGEYVPGDKDGDGGVDGFVYSGCYLAEGSNPFNEITEDAAMTPELCFHTCALRSALYMGLIRGNECGCGVDSSFLASDKEDGDCNEDCVGDAVQTCGGALAYDLFALFDTDTTDDYVDEDSTCTGGISGVESANGNVCCDTGCGICDGISCVGYGDCCEEKIQDSGVLCSDSGTAPCILDSGSDSPDRSSPAGGDDMTGFLYVGCYEAEAAYDPFSYLSQMDSMTLTSCSESCGSMGAAYAGVMDGDMCGCGSDDGYLESAKTSGTCFTECTGDDGRTEYCGGSDSFGLFRIIYGGTAIANSVDADGAVPSPAPEILGEFSYGATDVIYADPEVLTAYTHLGCFGFEVESNPFFSLEEMDGMTYHTCSESCGLVGGVYIGVLDGNMCGCGSLDGYLTSLKPAGICDVECAGSPFDTDMCGGTSSFDLFLVNYLANDDDYFGDSAPFSAGPSTSAGLEEGTAPYSDDDTLDVDSTTDWDTNWETGLSQDPISISSSDYDTTADVDSTTDYATGQTVPGSMTGFLYEGCYEIEADYDPFSSLSQIDSMTRRKCSELCGSLAAEYAGTMDGDLCGCGSAAGFLVSQKQAGSCLMECTGEEDGRIEMCGGSASFDLFKIVYSDTAGR